MSQQKGRKEQKAKEENKKTEDMIVATIRAFGRNKQEVITTCSYISRTLVHAGYSVKEAEFQKLKDDRLNITVRKSPSGQGTATFDKFAHIVFRYELRIRGEQMKILEILSLVSEYIQKPNVTTYLNISSVRECDIVTHRVLDMFEVANAQGKEPSEPVAC